MGLDVLRRKLLDCSPPNYRWPFFPDMALSGGYLPGGGAYPPSWSANATSVLCLELLPSATIVAERLFSEVSAHGVKVYIPPCQAYTLPPDGYYSGWYASYCNAFLFKCCFSWPVNSAMRCFHLASGRDTSSTTRTHHDFAVGFWVFVSWQPLTIAPRFQNPCTALFYF